jgi:hypothetical protein
LCSPNPSYFTGASTFTRNADNPNIVVARAFRPRPK